MARVTTVIPSEHQRFEFESDISPFYSLAAVVILAFLKRAKEPDHIILVKQFRPPVNAICIECPAGTQSRDSCYVPRGFRPMTVAFFRSH